MQARQDRLAAIRIADLDSVMFFSAILRAEDMEASCFGYLHRQAGVHHRVERAAVVECRADLLQVEAGQLVPVGKIAAVRYLEHQRRREQPGGLDQAQRGAVQRGLAAPCAGEGALHRHAQVVGRVGDAVDPGRGGIAGQGNARQIAVIGARLQCLRAAGGDRQHRRPAHGQQVGQARVGQGFGSQHNSRPRAVKHDRHAHAQVGAGAGHPFGDVRGKGHAVLRLSRVSERYLGQCEGN